MKDKARSIREILTDELNKRSSITNMEFSVDKIFEKDQAAEWMERLLICDENSDLRKRIKDMSPERLSHAIATYLLGIAVKEGLDLNFDFLPHLFSHETIGDAFYFFWSIICLCHDIGFQYEVCKSSASDAMDKHEGRQALLEIEHDLFELKEKDLQEYDILPDGEEGEWILNTLKLAKNYDKMRRQTKDNKKDHVRIDHGIGGALILYDILMKQYDRTISGTTVAQSVDGYRNPGDSAVQTIFTGEITANASHRRFAACSIIIACTVARHNMWTVSGREDIHRYEEYNLHALCAGEKDISVNAEKRLEQMLFMLDYMDTIDPVKGIYTRRAEEICRMKASEKSTKEELDKRRDLLLDGIRIEFRDDYLSQYRWGPVLKYRRFVISIDETSRDDDKKIFSAYCKCMKKISEWLKTKSPVFKYDAGYIFSVTYYYPFIFGARKSWPGGITEHEVAALCLYEGCGSSKADKFYQCHNMYQTINLLMMQDLEGEKIRICEEGQNPQGVYIEEWEKTLEIMTDIFTAQCKYMKYCENKSGAEPQDDNHAEKNIISCVLGPDCKIYRVDRQVNFKMMNDLKRTFAFTSTAKSGYLEHIACHKQDLLLLEIALAGKTPYVDYEEVLGADYVYLKEQEVLLPPFLKLGKVEKRDLSEAEKRQFCSAGKKKVSKYYVQFDGFEIQDETEDETELIECLHKNRDCAAAVLDKMRIERTTALSDTDIQCYCEWKKDFQTLVRLCFGNIWKIYGPDQI